MEVEHLSFPVRWSIGGNTDINFGDALAAHNIGLVSSKCPIFREWMKSSGLTESRDIKSKLGKESIARRNDIKRSLLAV